MAKQVFEPAVVALRDLGKGDSVASTLIEDLIAGKIPAGDKYGQYHWVVRGVLEMVAPTGHELGELRNVNADRRLFIEEAIRLGAPEPEPGPAAAASVPEPEAEPDEPEQSSTPAVDEA